MMKERDLWVLHNLLWSDLQELVQISWVNNFVSKYHKHYLNRKKPITFSLIISWHPWGDRCAICQRVWDERQRKVTFVLVIFIFVYGVDPSNSIWILCEDCLSRARKGESKQCASECIFFILHSFVSVISDWIPSGSLGCNVVIVKLWHIALN